MRREEEFRRFLARSGPSAANDIASHLEISQPTLSRLLAHLSNDILRAGKGKKTRYALKRPLPIDQERLPIFSIGPDGKAVKAAELQAVEPRGYYLESTSETISSRFHEGLPYLFEDLRPAGFLGRQVPRLYPDLQVPNDIRDWTDEHCLAYWVRYGWDLIGNFIFGETAFAAYLKNKLNPSNAVRNEDRSVEYPRLADLAMSSGVPGSSAGGEQAKFLTTCVSEGKMKQVLVKFSPHIGESVGQRIADLLVCEHLAHVTLRAHGMEASHSEIVAGDNRLFLQMERFDRTENGRRGMVSLLPLDMEFVGQAKSWSETAQGLLSLNKIDTTAHRSVLWLETFGRLIANTDMHLANISLYADGERLLGLAPAYDMLPMLYAPQQNQLVERAFDPPPPQISQASVWIEALDAARDFWNRVQSHSLISEGFKRITSGNEPKLARLSELNALLPKNS